MTTCNFSLHAGRVMKLMGSSEHTYHTIPPLRKPENNTLLLLTWTVVSDHQLDFLSEWASSEDGWNLYKQLARDVQRSQNVEQLALTMAALMRYRRLLPDHSDDSDKPIKGSYLADLDALLNGQSLGNSGIVGERMIFSLLRVLSSFMYKFEDLINFLATVLDREAPLLHVFDGFSDQYLSRRIKGQAHEAAIVELSHFKMPELREDDDLDWVTVPPPEELQEHVPAVLMPTDRGYLQSKEDAAYLLEACLSGKLAHSWRGPRDGEATISGNLFVWEANRAGFDRWRDGMEWTLREEDGFEVGKALDGSGLMKKTVSIPACGVIHHMVSYYTAEDAPTLARPSRSMTLRPELASYETAA
jgi:hypothetical protein